jgi:hypothetical protein
MTFWQGKLESRVSNLTLPYLPYLPTLQKASRRSPVLDSSISTASLVGHNGDKAGRLRIRSKTVSGLEERILKPGARIWN